MIGYNLVLLKDILERYGENETKKILSTFYCPLNKDVEDFLRNKSITFAQQGISATHLIFASVKGKMELIAYFTLAMKAISVSKTATSNNIKRKLNKFARRDEGSKSYTIPMPLIAQIGKNFKGGLNKTITGDELLEIACRKTKESQLIVGGKFTYLECEDKPKLVDFYKSNGFWVFDKRNIERSEKDVMDGEYLLQMLKYLK